MNTPISKLTAQTTLQKAVEKIGRYLGADRCFLYVRQPNQQRGRTAFQWRRNETIPDVIQPEWQSDTTDLPKEDPLIRAGLAMQPSVYVEDVEKAGPDVLNRDFEQRMFGHRALVHAHVQADGQLWGILQPCVFGRPRQWSPSERAYIEKQLPGLLAPIQAFVAE
ncbi:MAG TPA: GAF domain-containing protein [Fibrella sp.]|jgi:GAF domain-containing protein